MSAPTLEALEERVAELEAEVKQLKEQREQDKSDDAVPWWKKIVGIHQDDPGFEEALRAGREWRESFRPRDDEDES